MQVPVDYIPMIFKNSKELETVEICEEKNNEESIRLHFRCQHEFITFNKESELLECPNPECNLGEVDPDEYHKLYEDYFDVGDETERFDPER